MKNKKLNFLRCAKLLKDPNSKISCLYVESFLGRSADSQGLCKFGLLPLNKQHNFFYLKFSKVSPEQNLFFSLFKSENLKEKCKTFFKTIYYIKNRVGHFWELKKMSNNFKFRIFLLAIVL